MDRHVDVAVTSAYTRAADATTDDNDDDSDSGGGGTGDGFEGSCSAGTKLAGRNEGTGHRRGTIEMVHDDKHSSIGRDDVTAQQRKECQEGEQVLSQDQIDEYLREGVLVVPNILSHEELQLALEGMKSSLLRRLRRSKKDVDEGTSDQIDVLIDKLLDPSSSISSSTTPWCGVDVPSDLLDVLRKFRDELSSTNGSGGVLDIFWDEWKLQLVAHNPKLWNVTKQLWKAVYTNHDCGDIQNKDDWRYHPYNDDEERTIDFDKGYCYIDRVGYRLPTSISQEWGDMLYEHDQKQKHQKGDGEETTETRISPPSTTKSNKKKKFRSIQRSLTPHLDCCPDNLWGRTHNKGENNKTRDANDATGTRGPRKWRPIQCFVALTDTLNKNEGGFECVPGFHHEFHDWAKNRQHNSKGKSTPSSVLSSLCVGEYTHIRPTEERFIMDRVQHIPIKARSAVFWDIRIPHANSYQNKTNRPRQVVYCSFLPDIELNRSYVQNQLLAYQLNRPIRDQWNHIATTTIFPTNPSVHGNGKNENVNDGTHSANNNNQPARVQCDDFRNNPSNATFTELGQKLMGMKPW